MFDLWKCEEKMALGKRLSGGILGVGLVRSTSFGKKVYLASDVEIDSTVATPTKKHCREKSFLRSQQSLLEALPQDILIMILCAVEHEDLKSLFQVSKLIREASKMQELIPQEQSNTQSVSSGSILWSPNDVYAQVIGPERRGRVRGLGFGPTPSSHPDSIKSNSNNTTAFHTTQDQQRISQLEDELSSVKNLVASLLQRLDGQCECSIPNQNSPNGRPRSSAASRQMPNQSHDNDDGAE